MFRIFWLLRGFFYSAFFGRFGTLSYLGKPVFIKGFKRIFIDQKVRIFPGSRLEVVDSNSSILICCNTSIGQNLHIVSGEGRQIKIGSNTTISANVFITNVNHTYYKIDKHILAQPLQGLDTQIGENCFIGYGAVIQAGTILGKQCIVGSNSVVKGEFPDYSVVAGVPAKVIKKYDSLQKVWRKTDEHGSFVIDE